ncbi:MAG: hypothetical protein INR73_14275 [Williamsia sp.]|nr:hypothetical protein [Williamsia sp.]
MIKFQDLKVGDFVLADFEGDKWEGVVNKLNTEEKKALVQTRVQEFWFGPEELYPITLDEEQLNKLNFEKQENGDGSVKYVKGPFRIFLPEKGNFSKMDIWYREDRRHLNQAIPVHELQNHYLQMTKVTLARN